MKKILVFGNPYLKQDNLAIEISKELNIPNTEFVQCESFNEILNYEGDELIILDVIEGIKKTVLIKDLNQIQKTNSLTAHDFDLGFNLKLYFMKLFVCDGNSKKIQYK